RLTAGDVSEQVAERAALVAEGDVDVTVEVLSPLVAPDLLERQRLRQVAIGLLVRVAVDVARIGARRQLLAQLPGQLRRGRSEHTAPWSRSDGRCDGRNGRPRRGPRRGRP